MTDRILLPRLSRAETTELARMLLARKLMSEDRRGVLSPMVNAPLAQCVILADEISLSLAEWLPRLRDQFIGEMSDAQADPSLSRHLSNLKSNGERENLICQYFLPFQPAHHIDGSTPQSIAAAFVGNEIVSPPLRLDMGPIYPAVPENGSIVLPRPFVRSIFDQILIGRHSHLHLEARRLGKTNEAASDAVIHALMDILAALNADASAPRPFHTPLLHYEDFAQSFAYTQMMELGFSREEMLAVMSPWKLVD